MLLEEVLILCFILLPFYIRIFLWCPALKNRARKDAEHALQNSEVKTALMAIRLDFRDLQARLDWAISHDKEAQAIAEQAALQARMFIRREDIQCYWYRLLLEYASLLQQ